MSYLFIIRGFVPNLKGWDAPGWWLNVVRKSLYPPHVAINCAKNMSRFLGEVVFSSLPSRPIKVTWGFE
jgi:hypothetical protein